MHPNLAYHKHPSKSSNYNNFLFVNSNFEFNVIECLDVILRLEQCHNSGFFNKYFGGCNGIKKELNDCLTLEVTYFKNKSYSDFVKLFKKSLLFIIY